LRNLNVPPFQVVRKCLAGKLRPLIRIENLGLSLPQGYFILIESGIWEWSHP
jgi:hypothetical protein